MKKLLLALALLGLSACGGGPGTTPDSVAVTQNCYGSAVFGSQTCQVVFDDGQPGYTVKQSNGFSYMCKGNGL
jgi:hypothetical protein